MARREVDHAKPVMYYLPLIIQVRYKPAWAAWGIVLHLAD
jgi:hypothetical protein